MKALERKFYQQLNRGLGLLTLPDRNDHDTWPALKTAYKARFLEKTRPRWEQVFNGRDACCKPILGQDKVKEAGYEQRLTVGLTETSSWDATHPVTWNR